MESILYIAQIVISILLITAILLQARGGGLGAFGGAGTSFHSRRGIEKFLFRATIGLAAAFVFIALFALV